MGQTTGIELIDLGLQTLQHVRGVFVLAHQNDAGYDVVEITEAVAVTNDALLRHPRLDDLGKVADQHRCAIDLAHNHLTNFSRRLEQAKRAYQELLPALRHRTAAGIGVGALQCIEQLPEGQLVVTQSGQIRPHLVLADRTAERNNVSDTGHLFQLA